MFNAFIVINHETKKPILKDEKYILVTAKHDILDIDCGCQVYELRACTVIVGDGSFPESIKE